MAGGNRRPRAKQKVLIALPPELVTLLDIQRISKRYPSRSALVQKILESDPGLVELAERVYTAGNAQAPRSL